MRSGLLHIEQQIKQLRREMKIGSQEVRAEVAELKIAVQIGRIVEPGHLSRI